jgi:hypothetical protein
MKPMGARLAILPVLPPGGQGKNRQSGNQDGKLLAPQVLTIGKVSGSFPLSSETITSVPPPTSYP